MKVGGRFGSRAFRGCSPTERDDLRTQQIFELCISHVFPIVGWATGVIELEVGGVGGQPAYRHSIWIKPYCVEPVRSYRAGVS